jgi:hypothetical protein
MRVTVLCACVNALGIADEECQDCLGTGECEIAEDEAEQETDSGGMGLPAGV